MVKGGNEGEGTIGGWDGVTGTRGVWSEVFGLRGEWGHGGSGGKQLDTAEVGRDGRGCFGCLQGCRAPVGRSAGLEREA